MVNYSDLQYLFESTDTNKPYNVDTNILGLMNSTTFASVITIGAFLKNINNIISNNKQERKACALRSLIQL